MLAGKNRVSSRMLMELAAVITAKNFFPNHCEAALTGTVHFDRRSMQVVETQGGTNTSEFDRTFKSLYHGDLFWVPKQDRRLCILQKKNL